MISRFYSSFSLLGLLAGLLFLSVSLTPSLLPRVPLVQGVLAGFAFAVGYGAGRFAEFLWWLLELPPLAGHIRRAVLGTLIAGSAALVLITFGRMDVWQNSIRSRMEMPPVEATDPWLVALIALACALVLILAAWGVLWLVGQAGDALARVLPRRSAIAAGSLLVASVVLVLGNDLVLQRAIHSADTVFYNIDRITHEGRMPPAHGFSSGGGNSVIDWDDIGTNGKDFLTQGPDRAEISAFWGQEAQQPVRVYAGYGTGKSFETRAQAALADLIALGGFQRSVLIVATPTGTGWLDPAAMQPLPYLHKGDLAIVSLQYAYVPSWMSIMIEPDRARRASQALFDAVYGHWRTLDPAKRPELYLFGLSLGAQGSEATADLVTIWGDPIDGAFWAGPPFTSTSWARITAGRNPGSPARLPEYRDGAMVRFMNQDGIAAPEGGEWGSMRLLYLQHASDPMVFFSPTLAFRRPAWLGEDRGRDISEYFDWYPLVTFLQVGFDVPMATSTPPGYGHTYDAREYITGWIEVTQPKGWSDAMTDKLTAQFEGFTASPI